MSFVKTLQQSNQVASRKTTKRSADEANEMAKKNTSSAAVPPASSSSHKSASHVPASIRNIHRLSTLDSQMTNGGRYSNVSRLVMFSSDCKSFVC